MTFGRKAVSTRPKPSVRDDSGPVPQLNLATAIRVRSTPLSILALLALIAFLHWAQVVFIPIVFAVLLSYALTPIVNWLRKNARLHKAIGAAVTLSLLLGGLGIGLSALQPEALDILDLVPRATAKFRAALHGNAVTASGAVAKLQKAASEIEKAATAAASPTSPPPAVGTTKPATDTPFKIRDYLLTGTVGLATGLWQLVVVVALVYLLLIAGDSFRRTLLSVSGDSLWKKKITVTILDEIDGQIQRYLLVQIATSVLLAVVAWAVFTWIGLDNAATWACVGGVLHLIPYVGPAAFLVLVGVVAYVQFDSLQPVLLLIGTMIASLSVIALLLVPWLTQKIGPLNAVTVFVALLFWGWVWGVWGLLLGVPIVMAVKAVCDRVEDLRPISAFLGPRPPTAKADDSR
jgi:predicted PurR-regulated permease PerM